MTDTPLLERLRGLIERLEKLEGPSTEANADILEATGGCAHRETEYYCIEDGNDYDSGFTCKRCGVDTYGQRTPAYTASLETAVTLLERVLPGWKWRVSTNQGEVFQSDPECGHDGFAATSAIALVIATLRALSQEQSK